MDTARKQLRAMGVAQIVKPNSLQFRTSTQEMVERVGERPRLIRQPVATHHHMMVVGKPNAMPQ